MAKDGVKKVKKVKKVAEDGVEEVKVVEEPAVVETVNATEAAPVEEKPAEIKAEEKVVEKADEKMEEKTEEKVEEPKVELPKDVESDAPEDARKRTTLVAAMNTHDTTLNALVSDGAILTSFQQGGLGLLLSGVRGNIGVKSGRYYFETKCVETRGKHEVKIGFSTLSAPLTGGDKSFLFSTTEAQFLNGSTKVATSGKRAQPYDVVGVLLNRGEGSEQCNTVSLFINGVRASEPKKIEFEGPLYPHVLFKSCSVVVNFKKLFAPLPFTVRPISDASADDVALSSVVSAGEPEVVFPIGWDVAEFVTEFAAKNPTHEVLTAATLAEWQKKSNAVGRNEVHCTNDGGKSIGQLLRNRKYIVALSKDNAEGIFAADRTKACSRFSGYKKIAKVMLGKTEKTHAKYKDVSLPTESEGFDVIDYVKPKAECEAELEAWKADCKLRSLVEDLKVGTWYKEQIAEVKKLIEEKKADKEAYAEFTPEDWILTLLRAELHYIIHAFKTDVNDDAREGFAAAHLSFYYRKYNNRDLHFGSYGMKNIEELCEELLSDLIEIDEKTLLRAKVAKDCDKITFLEQAEADRNDRANRLDAGDENAALKFTARSFNNKPVNKIPIPGHKGQGKGAAMGNKIPLGTKVPQPVRPQPTGAPQVVRRPIPLQAQTLGQARPIQTHQLRAIPQAIGQKRAAVYHAPQTQFAKRRR